MQGSSRNNPDHLGTLIDAKLSRCYLTGRVVEALGTHICVPYKDFVCLRGLDVGRGIFERPEK